MANDYAGCLLLLHYKEHFNKRYFWPDKTAIHFSHKKALEWVAVSGGIVSQPTLEDIYNTCCLHESSNITYDPAHPCHHPFALLLSSRCHSAPPDWETDSPPGPSLSWIRSLTIPHNFQLGCIHTPYTHSLDAPGKTPATIDCVAVDILYHDDAGPVIAIKFCLYIYMKMLILLKNQHTKKQFIWKTKQKNSNLQNFS